MMDRRGEISLGIGISIAYTLVTLYAAATGDLVWRDVSIWAAYLFGVVALASWWVDSDEVVALRGGQVVGLIRIVLLLVQVSALSHAEMNNTVLVRIATEICGYLRMRAALRNLEL